MRGLTRLENLALTYITGTGADDADAKVGGLVKRYKVNAATVDLLIGDAVIFSTAAGCVEKAAAGSFAGIVVGGETINSGVEDAIFGDRAGEIGLTAAVAGQWVYVLQQGIANAVSDASAAVGYGNVCIISAGAAGQIKVGAATAGELAMIALSSGAFQSNDVIKVLVH